MKAKSAAHMFDWVTLWSSLAIAVLGTACAERGGLWLCLVIAVGRIIAEKFIVSSYERRCESLEELLARQREVIERYISHKDGEKPNEAKD